MNLIGIRPEVNNFRTPDAGRSSPAAPDIMSCFGKVLPMTNGQCASGRLHLSGVKRQVASPNFISVDARARALCARRLGGWQKEMQKGNRKGLIRIASQRM